MKFCELFLKMLRRTQTNWVSFLYTSNQALVEAYTFASILMQILVWSTGSLDLLLLNTFFILVHFKSVATIHKEVFTGKGSVVSELPKPDEPQKVPAFLKKYEQYLLVAFSVTMLNDSN